MPPCLGACSFGAHHQGGAGLPRAYYAHRTPQHGERRTLSQGVPGGVPGGGMPLGAPYAVHTTFQFGDSAGFAYGKRERLRQVGYT